MSRAKAMRIFLNEFIGSSNSDCIIANPDEIYLRYNKKKDLLTTGADKPFTDTEQALGEEQINKLLPFEFMPSK
jgi:hypothetical protein